MEPGTNTNNSQDPFSGAGGENSVSPLGEGRANPSQPSTLAARLNTQEAERNAAILGKGSFIKKADPVNTPRWADMLSDEEEEAFAPIKDDSLMAALRAIRNRTKGEGISTVIIPSGIRTQLLKLFQKLERAAFITKMKLVEDSRNEFRLSFPNIWSEDNDSRQLALNEVSNSLNKKAIKGVENLIALYESLEEIPSGFEEGEGGKEAILFLLSIMPAIKCEAELGVPLSRQKSWWKDSNLIKKNLIESIGQVVGGEQPATSLVTAVEIIYRKLIRDRMNKTDETSKKVMDICFNLKKAMISKGTTLFKTFLRKSTLKKTVIKYVDDNGKKLSKPKEEEVSVLVYNRPTLDSGVSLPGESSFVSAFNNCMTKVEQDFEKIEAYQYPNLLVWEERVREFASLLYSKTTEVQRLFQDRKTKIRFLCIENRKSTAASSNKMLSSNELSAPMTAIEFNSVKEKIFSSESELLSRSFDAAVKSLLGLDKPKEDISEHDIRVVVRSWLRTE